MELDAISAWFSSHGIHPLVGGFLAGSLAMLLLRVSTSSARTVTVGSPGAGASLSMGLQQPGGGGAIRSLGTQITVNNNGSEFTLTDDVSREVLDHLAGGRKIEAIKALREASGLDLLGAKNLVEVLEKHRRD